MSKSIHNQVMSPSCLGDFRGCGCEPRLRPSKLGLIPAASPGTGGSHLPCQAEPGAKPQPRAGGAQGVHWKIKCWKEGKEIEAQEFLICLVEETQIPAERRSWR